VAEAMTSGKRPKAMRRRGRQLLVHTCMWCVAAARIVESKGVKVTAGLCMVQACPEGGGWGGGLPVRGIPNQVPGTLIRTWVAGA
jgi:hypothetical protein